MIVSMKKNYTFFQKKICNLTQLAFTCENNFGRLKLIILFCKKISSGFSKNVECFSLFRSQWKQIKSRLFGPCFCGRIYWTFCVLLYTRLIPIISFSKKKLSGGFYRRLRSVFGLKREAIFCFISIFLRLLCIKKSQFKLFKCAIVSVMGRNIL